MLAMWWYLWAGLVLQPIKWVQCVPPRPSKNTDPGAPLFLTPYIERGNITEAKRLAHVSITDKLQIKSFAGFLTVNKTYNSNHFFWYFPAILENKRKAPVIVWLQGGPGKSSLIGLFAENGPIYVKRGNFKRRYINWAVNHHVIYIDNPVGTGFSFTNDSRGYCTDETQVGEQLYSTITQFFKLFPSLRRNPFFVTGERYAGKYVPALAYTIHKKNPTAEEKINLKGIAIGNGWSDPEHQLLYSKHLYQIGLVDWNDARVLEEHENRTRDYIRHGQWDNATQAFREFSNIIANITGLYSFFYNCLHRNYDYSYLDIVPHIERPGFRRSIHVGNLPLNNIKGSCLVNIHLKQDYMKSVAPWIGELLDHYKVLFYNGQLDISVSYPLTVNFLENLKYNGSELYKNAERHVWLVGNEVRGYAKQANNLLEVMIINADHSVPVDQPKWALDLISTFTHCLPLGTFIDVEDDAVFYDLP